MGFPYVYFLFEHLLIEAEGARLLPEINGPLAEPSFMRMDRK